MSFHDTSKNSTLTKIPTQPKKRSVYNNIDTTLHHYKKKNVLKKASHWVMGTGSKTSCKSSGGSGARAGCAAAASEPYAGPTTTTY